MAAWSGRCRRTPGEYHSHFDQLVESGGVQVLDGIRGKIKARESLEILVAGGRLGDVDQTEPCSCSQPPFVF